MELRNYIGIVLIAVGTILFPIGWMFSRTIFVLGFLLFFIGVVVFMTKCYLNKAENEETGHTKSKGVPTDINEHSGWGHGGRNKNWEGSSDFSGDDGGD